MLQTYLVYFGCLLLCCWLANRAASYDSKRYMWVVISVLTLISGLRGYQVGLDTYSYITKYAYIAQGESQYAYGLEKSFKAVCWLLSRISDNETFFLFVMALITNGLIIRRFWDFRKVSSFPMMVFCYCCAHYFMTMNGIRQYCAVAIVFFFTRYLDRKKLIPFLWGVLAAACFHSSALVGLLFAVEQFSNWSQLSKRERRLLMLCILAMPAAVIYVVYITLSRYSSYFILRELNIGLMLPAKLLLFALSMLFMVQLYKRFRRAEGIPGAVEKAETDKIPWICYAYTLGIFFTSLGYFFRQMDRVGWYFYLYEGVYYGIFRKDRDAKNRFFFGGCIAVLLLYAFADSIMNNGQGQVPYTFFWQIF